MKNLHTFALTLLLCVFVCLWGIEVKKRITLKQKPDVEKVKSLASVVSDSNVKIVLWALAGSMYMGDTEILTAFSIDYCEAIREEMESLNEK